MVAVITHYFTHLPPAACVSVKGVEACELRWLFDVARTNILTRLR